MQKIILLVWTLFYFFPVATYARQPVKNNRIRLSVRITEADSHQITPAMICITNLKDSQVYTPPDGLIAERLSYPNFFFKGVDFSSDKNWHGPIRKMNGPGAVNGARTYVYGMLPSFPHWKEPVMYQVSGDFSILLPPGEWRISIAHGYEYIPVTDQFSLAPGRKSVAKTYQLKRWINLPRAGWYSGDVHAHHPSDKPSFKEYLMQMAKAEDLHLVNMLEMGDRYTTEFRTSGYGDSFTISRNNYSLVFGQEEPRSDYGHVLGLNTAALARDTARYNYYDLVFDKLHQRKEAIVGFAHFAYRGEGVIKGMALFAPSGAIDFVELLQNSQINTEDYYDWLNAGIRIAAAAGSDFPWGSAIGDCRTYVYTGLPFSAKAWCAGLKAGNSFVSNGPALFLTADGKMPGTEIKTTTSTAINIKVKAFSNPVIGKINRIQLLNNDGVLLETKNIKGLDSLEVNLKHILNKSQWLVAAVYCDNSALAHTSPVYFIVDGQPVFDKQKGPKVIEKQMRVIEEMKAEEMKKKIPDTGILSRIDKADGWYRNILQKNRP